MDRRAYLGTVGGLAVVGLAGCTDLLGDDPESVVEQYYEALAAGDQETIDDLFYDELPAPSIDEEGRNVTVDSIERASVRDVVERDERDRDDDDLDAAVEQARTNIEGQAEQIGADDYAVVLAKVEVDGEERSPPFILVEIDGEWQILQ